MIPRNKIHMLGLAAMFLNPTWPPSERRQYIEPKETEAERKARLEKAQIKRYKEQGLTEFFYGEKSLWALNQKTADKKAKNRNWI